MVAEATNLAPASSELRHPQLQPWDVKYLSDIVCRLRLGGNYPNTNKSSSFPLIKMGNLGRGTIVLDKVEYLSSNAKPDPVDRLRFGDLLFNTRNTLELVGKVAVWRNELPEAYFNSNILRLEFSEEFVANNFFINYLFQTRRTLQQLRALATGTTSVAAIYTRDLLNLELPLPPKAEQQRIATILSDTDALISALEKLIEKKRNIKQGVMQELLTGKRRLPGFSGEWKVYSIASLFKFLSTANNSRSDLSSNGTVQYLHYGDIHTHNSPFLDLERDNLSFIEPDKVRGIPLLQEGDLILADASEDYAGIGKGVELRNLGNKKIVAGLHTFALRADKSILVDGFKAYLQFFQSVRQSLLRLATGVSVYGISKSNVRGIDVEIPPPSEQRAIADVLNGIERETDELTERLTKLRLMKLALMQTLLSGKIRLIS